MTKDAAQRSRWTFYEAVIFTRAFLKLTVMIRGQDMFQKTFLHLHYEPCMAPLHAFLIDKNKKKAYGQILMVIYDDI
jgi:hypothetical protein